MSSHRLTMRSLIWVCVRSRLNAEDFAKDRLDKSPRHREWVQVKSGDKIVHSFEMKQKAPVVVVIHENQGLTDWVRSVADQMAEAGFHG